MASTAATAIISTSRLTRKEHNMRGFLRWLKSFFAVDNAVNEDTVMGVLYSIALIVAIFSGVSNESIWILAGIVVSFFGLGALKR